MSGISEKYFIGPNAKFDARVPPPAILHPKGPGGASFRATSISPASEVVLGTLLGGSSPSLTSFGIVLNLPLTPKLRFGIDSDYGVCAEKASHGSRF
jgi:hypothetical protein